MDEAMGPAPENDKRRAGTPKWTRRTFFAFFLLLSAVGYGAYLHQRGLEKIEIENHVKAIGHLKAGQIEQWLEERRREILILSTGPKIALDYETWQKSGSITPELKDWLAGRLAQARKIGKYRDAAVLGLDGSVLLTGGGDIETSGYRWDSLAGKSMREGTVEFSPLFRLDTFPDKPVAIDVLAPLTAEDERGTRIVGTMVHRIDANDYLYPLIQTWPTNSPSGETLLVAQSGGDVLFLNELRHLKETALSMRRPVSEERLLAAKAVRGERGVVEGIDYRGVPVLGAINAVAGSNWLLVSKIDQREVYAPLVLYLKLYLGFVAGCAVITWLVMSNWLRGIAEANLRREHEATTHYVGELERSQKERQDLIEELQQALADVKTLRGLLPICASCKKIRDDKGAWNQLEKYVSEHSEATFSHGLCPECMKKLYPEYTGKK